MMMFTEFVDEIEKGVAAMMGDGYTVAKGKVTKDNGLTLTGLVINKAGSHIAPVISLDYLYQTYMGGGRISGLWLNPLQ